ncbi:MAG: glycogen debranching enzyme, partial [Spirochaetia bacterium]|nr:glycogen debranching enzyme [Spirochaetia bacterium]
AEGDHTGPTFSFRGFENRAYYIPHPDDRGRYADFSGCGNTVNGNQSIVRRMIVDCLRYWVSVMHVDAFRFDLASVLARDEWGNPLKSPPILWEIESDPILAGTRIIAEAWDAAGLYQLGSFVGHRWAEWNGRFRDDVRRFFRGDLGSVPAMAARVSGSTDVYPEKEREVHRSINFITCHDGFTLRDLVSYNGKHNEENGWQNRDGMNENFSWNCGVEGSTDQAGVISLRERQSKNMLAALFLSQGTQMMLMGDEAGRTQRGNNNAYCQDNPISWFDWRDPEANAGLLRFARKLIQMRRVNPFFLLETPWLIRPDGGKPALRWSGVKSGEPDWRDISHTLAFTLRHPSKKHGLHVILNSYYEDLDFELPGFAEGRRWHRLIDTSLPSPEDFVEDVSATLHDKAAYKTRPRSVVVLVEDGVMSRVEEVLDPSPS